MQQPPFDRFAPALAAFILFGLLATLWITHQTALYRHVITIWGVDAFDFPFLDTETMLSGARCLRAGVDIYVSNPCDALGRIYDYSPLWMVIAYWPVTMAWGVPIGLIIAFLYCGALTLLPAGRTRGHRIALALGAISTVAMFAVERGNNDLILFALAAAAATLACRSPAIRLIGYGCALIAGLLKYYPMVLIAMAVRERRARSFAIAITAALATALFVALAWDDLGRALRLIPTGGYYSAMFGSVQFAGGVQQLFGLPPMAIGSIRWVTTIAALGTAGWLASRPATVTALANLTSAERAFLLAGGLLTLACFFTAQNIGYRAIHLLLALPALLALRAGGARLFRFAPAIVLALLWADGWRKALLYAAKPFGLNTRIAANFFGWLVDQSLWWWAIVLLATAVIALLSRSTSLGRRPILWA